MGIGRVAIRALGENQRAAEIGFGMAFRAGHFQVHPGERILCFRMVERRRHGDFFPAAGVVTGFARCLKAALVRVRMTRGAGVKFQAGKLKGMIRTCRVMALVASHLGMKPRERVFRLGVVELLHLFPVGDIVAALAIRSQLAFVEIGVATDAVLRKPQEGRREILLFDQRALGGDDMRGRVAFLAFEGGMFLRQRIPGLAMIELLLRWVPMHESEVYAVVLQVAAHAIPAVGILHAQLCVKSPAHRQALGDLLVAIETLKGRRAGAKLVTGGALCPAFHGLMCFGKRPRRHLGVSGARDEQQACDRGQQETSEPRHGDTPPGLICSVQPHKFLWLKAMDHRHTVLHISTYTIGGCHLLWYAPPHVSSVKLCPLVQTASFAVSKMPRSFRLLRGLFRSCAFARFCALLYPLFGQKTDIAYAPGWEELQRPWRIG